jgi:hypothetical protein
MNLTLSAAFDFEKHHKAVENALSKTVFFIAGCGKSGTTWVQNILDAHPEVACRGEIGLEQYLLPAVARTLDEYNSVSERNHKRAYSDQAYHSHFDSAHMQYLLCSTLGLLFNEWITKPGVKCVGDKTPENALCMGLLDAVGMKPKFVHVIRDGRDATVSGWNHSSRTHLRQLRKQFPGSADYAESFAGAWVQHVTAAREYSKRIPERYLEIRYEALKESPDEIVRELFQFLGVKFNKAVIQTSLQAASFEVQSGGRAPGSEDQRSFYRKGVSGEWKQKFGDQARQRFMHVAGDLLEELGCEV